jgi:hypothetical protein
MSRLRRFLPPQVADLIVSSGSEKQLESHRREITALFCDLRGFTGFTESADAEDVMALLRDYHAAIGELVIRPTKCPAGSKRGLSITCVTKTRMREGALTITFSRIGWFFSKVRKGGFSFLEMI